MDTIAHRSNAQMAQPDTEQSIMSRSNSATSVAEQRIRPKSRGSTASLQSVGVGNAFQPPPHHHQEQVVPIDHNGVYIQHAQPQMQNMYAHRPEDAMIHYPHHMVSAQHAQPIMDHAAVSMAHDMRPMSRQGYHDVAAYPIHYPSGMPQYSVSQSHMQHMRHQSYEGSPAPEDSQNEGLGAKRRKGAASSMANDQELRRLLTQYQGKTLKEIAAEVQKNEGSGGKSEKAKQVFAMLWLQESCQRSTNSVRRDRVFARYTERCGNERVPTLNPASFGKLVRIIFPNVQTRRLGVRGESKYHYVDLSLVPDDEDRQQSILERPGTAGSIAPQRPDSVATDKPFSSHTRATSVNYVPTRDSMDTADFPLPSPTLFTQPRIKPIERPLTQDVRKLDCRFLNTPTIRIPLSGMPTNLVNALPAVRANLPATMATYLAMPSEFSLSGSSSQDTPIELPDIHEYLKGTSYDHHLAKLLHDLYRSYCIDVIDAFRKCKEKSFFNHHSAFNGKMTVPVSKLFSLDCVAAWIQECDMRMYKQIVKFLAALAQQNVPDSVWAMFDRVSTKLVSHLVAAFEEKCPTHVVVAKVVPAARFSTLLKKLKGANAAALQLSRILEDPRQRTQMWLDLVSMVDPNGVLDDSNPPPENLSSVQEMLRHDFRVLISPVDGELVTAAENDPTSSYADLLSEPSHFGGILPTFEQPMGLLERWIQWLERLPMAFKGHHPQCMMDWHSRFWRSIMSHIGTNGAPSYQSFWYLENFATQMLAYMTNMEGFLLSSEEQKRLDSREMEKVQQDTEHVEHISPKRKRDAHDIGGEERSQSSQHARDMARTTTPLAATNDSTDMFHSTATMHSMENNLPATTAEEDTDAEMDELRRGGPLDLPSFRTGLTSPIKQDDHVTRDNQAHIDDSGIDLGLDMASGTDPDAIEAEKEVKKFNKRDWLLSSDPVEAPMSGLGVVV